jgi:hypothetical protein
VPTAHKQIAKTRLRFYGKKIAGPSAPYTAQRKNCKNFESINWQVRSEPAHLLAISTTHRDQQTARWRNPDSNADYGVLKPLQNLCAAEGSVNGPNGVGILPRQRISQDGVASNSAANRPEEDREGH